MATNYYGLGSQGQGISEIQDSLAKLGYDVGTIDGIFGQKTQNAVMKFQTDKGLTVDGIVGPETYGALQPQPQTQVPFEALPDTGVVTDTMGSVPTPTPPPITQTPPPQQQAVNVQPVQQAPQQTQQPVQQPVQQQPVQAPQAPVQQMPQAQPPIQQGAYPQQQYQMPQFQMPQFQYNPQYQQLTNAATSQYLQRLNSGFQYDPSQDQSLQQAGKEMERQTLETMNQRGILNSTMTADSIAAGWAKLMPQYYQIAYGQYNDELARLQDFANFTMQLDQTNYNRMLDQWKADKESIAFQYEQYLNQIDQQRQEIDDAWNKVEQLGYADNYSAAILGIQPGTMSKTARQAYEKHQMDIESMYAELQIWGKKQAVQAQYESQILQEKAELDRQQALLDYQLGLEESGYQNELKKDYFDYTQQGTEATPQEQNIPGLEYSQSQFENYRMLKQALNQAANPFVTPTDEQGNPMNPSDPLYSQTEVLTPEQQTEYRQYIYDELNTEEARAQYVPLIGKRLYESLLENFRTPEAEPERFDMGVKNDFEQQIYSNYVRTDPLTEQKIIDKVGALRFLKNAVDNKAITQTEADYLISLFALDTPTDTSGTVPETTYEGGFD